jgi:aubergine-like protein
MLFMTTKLPQDQMTFDCETREGKKHKMIIKYTKQIIDRSDPRVLQILNIMLRRAMEGLNLRLIQRNLFDPGNAVSYFLQIFGVYLQIMSC